MKIACPSCRQKLDVTDLVPFARVRCPRCAGEVIAPKLFGSLLLEEPLGRRRGMSAYRALDLTLDREVLVEVLDPDLAVFGHDFRALARGAAALNHHGVVPVYSCGEEQGLHYFVTQFMPGGALTDRLGGSPGSPETIRQGVEWSRSIAGGLQVAASHGVVHGAVTPRSILLDADGHAKLTDFGIDLLLVGHLDPASACGSEVAAYLSPEVLRLSPPTPASDIFGLGAVLYHVLCGNGPCGPAADGAVARAFWQEGRRPLPASSLNPSVSQELSEVCLRMLSADPLGRPGDAAEVVQLLATGVQARRAPESLSVPRRSRGRRPAVRPTQRLPQRAGRGLLPLSEHWMNTLISGCIVAVLVLGMLLYARTQGYPPWMAPERVPDTVPAPEASIETRTAAPACLPPGSPHDAVAPAPPPEPATAASPCPALEPPGPLGDVTPTSRQTRDAIRPYAARRPRPAGLDFDAVRTEVEQYLQGLPPDALADERERLDLIEGTRNHLVRLMEHVPFMEGRESPIRLRSGSFLRGTVPYCNGSQVAVRIAGGKTLRLLPWQDLAIEQVIAFLDFYLSVRKEQSQAATGAGNRTQRRAVADEYLRLAVLCDWYGRQQDATRYARQAQDASPADALRVQRLLPTVAP